ncbi:MAG: hypothetical protein ACTSQE_12600 [Candidatus Heimdallarchaeaceae archaeon]
MKNNKKKLKLKKTIHTLKKTTQVSKAKKLKLNKAVQEVKNEPIVINQDNAIEVIGKAKDILEKKSKEYREPFVLTNKKNFIKKKNKKPTIEPTERQKKAFKSLVENGRTKGEAMKEAGYSESVQKAPTKVTRSEGWQILIDEHLSDKTLAKVHMEGLKAMRGKEPDHMVRHKYLDTAYKIKGDYAPEKKEVEFNASDLLDMLNEED